MKVLIAIFVLFTILNAAIDKVESAARLPIMYDPYWPTDCSVPDCDEAQRAINYPAPLAKHYYQCTYDGARWIPQLIPCPCDLVFSYKDQQCVYPWSIQKWCENEYIVDILPINCR